MTTLKDYARDLLLDAIIKSIEVNEIKESYRVLSEEEIDELLSEFMIKARNLIG